MDAMWILHMIVEIGISDSDLLKDARMPLI